MKQRVLGALLAGLAIGLCFPGNLFGNVSVTPATGGTNILADTAANSPTPSWTSLGPITIAETAPGDFGNGNGKTFVLEAPGGFQFNPAQIPSVDFTPGRNITALSVSSLTTNKLTLSISVSGTDSNDSLTIGLSTSLQVRPTLGSPLPAARNIFRPSSGGGNETIAGVTNDSTGSAGTSFGALSEIAGTVAGLGFTTQPGQAAPGVVFGTQPVVQTQDQFGNNSTLGLPASLPVNLALTSGPGNLSGTTNQDAGTNAANGVIAYTDLAIDTAGTNDQLTATASNLTSAISGNFSVKFAQTINFPAPSNHLYGDSFALSATASSGLPVSFSVLSGPAVITNTTISLKGTGSVTVRASQAGNSNYLPATNVDDTFSVGPAALTIAVNNTNRPYLAANPVFTARYTSLLNGDTPASLTGTLSFSTSANSNSLVGAYLVGCSGQSSTNYMITFVSGALNVTPVRWTTNSGGNGHFYEAQFVSAGITWSNAFAAAQARGGYLATLTSAAENDFAYSLVSGNSNFWVFDGSGGDGPWLGAYRLPGPNSPTNWAWITGEAFAYNNWGPNQPNNFGGHQNFIQLYSPNSATGEFWNDAGDVDLQFTHSYLVEYDTFTNKIAQTIAFAPLPDKASGDPPFTLSATASSGLPVTFTILSGPASLAGNTLTINGVGTVIIDASQPGNSNYFAAPDAVQSFNVDRTLWYTNAGGNGHLYEVGHVVSGITWSNAEALAESAGGYLASVTSSNENTFVLSLVSANSNLWIINAGSGTAFGPWLGGIAGPGTPSPTNWTWVNGDPFVFQSWGPFWPDTKGDHIQLFSPTLPFTNGWSDLPDTGVALSYIIEYDRDPNTRSNQTISFGPLPDQTYGHPPFNLAATNTSGLPIVYTVIYGSATISNGNSLNLNSVGTVVVQASAAGNSNYFPATPVNAQFNVNPAPLSVTTSNATRAYGATNPIFAGLLNGVQNNDNITATYASPATAASGVGQYPIVPTLVDPGNRLPNYTVSVTNGILTVAPTALSVTASNAMRLYGATNPIFTGLLTGVQNNDSITATFSSAAATNSPVGLYAIVPALVDPNNSLTNYSVFSSNGVLAVTQASLSVTASNATRSYGATNPVFTGVLSGLQNNDNITATYATAAISNSHPGLYAIVPTLVDPGNLLTNYTVSSSNGVLTVTPALLSVTASNATRPFGAANPVFTGSIVGIQNGENITATYSTPASNSSPAGTYPIIPSLVDPGMVLSNYNVSITNGTLTVTPSAAFSIQSVSITGGTNILITWGSTSNLTYRVQYQTGLGMTNWTSLTPDVVATNITASITDTNATDAQRFYRVLQLSQ